MPRSINVKVKGTTRRERSQTTAHINIHRLTLSFSLSLFYPRIPGSLNFAFPPAWPSPPPLRSAQPFPFHSARSVPFRFISVHAITPGSLVIRSPVQCCNLPRAAPLLLSTLFTFPSLSPNPRLLPFSTAPLSLSPRATILSCAKDTYPRFLLGNTAEYLATRSR